MENDIDVIKDAFFDLTNEAVDVEVIKENGIIVYKVLWYRITFDKMKNGSEAYKRYTVEDIFDIIDYTATFNAAIGAVIKNFLNREVDKYIECLDNAENNYIM